MVVTLWLKRVIHQYVYQLVNLLKSSSVIDTDFVYYCPRTMFRTRQYKIIISWQHEKLHSRSACLSMLCRLGHGNEGEKS